MPQNPSENKYPNNQPDSSPAQCAATTSCPITVTWEQRLPAQLSGVVGSDVVSPELPFPTLTIPFPQLLPTALCSRTLPAPFPSPEMLQGLHVSFVWEPNNEHSTEVQFSPVLRSGEQSFPCSYGYTTFDTTQDAVGLNGHLGTRLEASL